MHHVDWRIAQKLNSIGLTIGANQVEIADFHEAETCRVHHAMMPVALTGYTLVSPEFARGRFPKQTFAGLVNKRSQMNYDEALALAAICKAEAMPPFWSSPAPFVAQINTVLERYGIGGFFDGTGSDNLYDIAPCGHNDDADSPKIKEWREAFRELPPEKQLMIVTIIILRSGEGSHWLQGMKKHLAIDAICTLRDVGALADWARLVALYPGW